MAKKSSKKTHLNFLAKANFSVVVPPDLLDSFKKDLGRRELGLDVRVEVGDISHGFTIYADEAVDGNIEFDLRGGECVVSVSCLIKKELDPVHHIDLIEAVTGGGVSARLFALGDHSYNDYYIDGEEDKTIEFAVLSVTV